MKVHDPDGKIPDEGTRLRHPQREKSDIHNVPVEQTDRTSTVPEYVVEVREPYPEMAGGTGVEMYVVVEVVSTTVPDFLEEGDTFLVHLDTLTGEKYEELN